MIVAEFRMPALGADMEVGTILEWLVKPGDTTKRGDIIAVVDMEKATIEVEVFETGIIQEILVPLGEKVPIGTLLALIRTDGEVVAPPAAKPKPAAAIPPVVAPVAPAPPRPPMPARVEKPPPPKMPPAAPGRFRISPLAMRTAVELKVDLCTVKGTGPHGAITRADVERAAAAPVAPAPPSEEAPAPAAAPAVEAPKAAPQRKPAVPQRNAVRRCGR